MPIPKVIYQTWKTKDLHPNCIAVRDSIQELNPDYSMVLYDDDEMDEFIKTNFNEFIYSCYSQLNVGAAKADFWRYCVLYINGGVYLDIDSDIIRPLEELIRGDEQCIITRERNPGFFNNWIMIFEKGHPILLESINLCCHNIINKTTTDVAFLTGPDGAFTDAIKNIVGPLYGKDVPLYYEKDADLNAVLNNPANPVRCRFFGYDMDSFSRWKHEYCDDLYRGFVYWRDEKQIFKEVVTDAAATAAAAKP